METRTRVEQTITVNSQAFVHGTPLPRHHTCDDANVSPPLALANIPADAQALAIIMDDPDAPTRTFTHWTAWNLPTRATDLPEDASISDLGGIEGANDAGGTGYHGPCPPSGTHRYFFKVYALDAPLALRQGASATDVHDAVDAHVIAWGELMGTYARTR